MKRFSCACGNRVFFDNTSCLRCGRALGFLPDVREMVAIEPAGGAPGLWHACGGDQVKSRRYRQCVHYSRDAVCNWMVAEEDETPFCVACRLNRTIPDLTIDGNFRRWAQLEGAKRYMLYGLLQLGLPVHGKDIDEHTGLAFTFMADEEYANGDTGPVLTGHTLGTITINIAEADDVHREATRVRMGEPYRTLLGHFRHEVGHYYWERLVRDTNHLATFRQCFGDERTDYNEALNRYYINPPADWRGQHISAYASSHPWEDWAETWAHYMHLQDTLETARELGLSLAYADPAGTVHPNPDEADFDVRMGHWVTLAVAMNSLSRSVGSPDIYPFTIGPGVVEKLRVVDRLIRECRQASH
ncbi:MAG: putative zinc-binding peptidase [Aquisalimonadaceae bacterium]